ncbi:MAG: HIT domain-containing protein [Caldilineales bacterium]
MQYIVGPKAEQCVFCDKFHVEDDAAEHILLRGHATYVTLNRYPYNNGHLLVVPYVHTASLETLPIETLTEMMVMVNRSLAALRVAMQPQGFNVGVNLGKAGGAGIEAHVHIHIVPRWHGDNNFIAAIGDTRMIPEMLDSTYQRLRAALSSMDTPA